MASDSVSQEGVNSAEYSFKTRFHLFARMLLDLQDNLS